MAKFTEIPGHVIEEYNTDVLNPSDPSTYGSASSGMLWRDNSGIITTDTNPFELYKKSDDSNFELVKATIDSSWNSESDVIKLARLFTHSITPSDDILRTVEESGYKRITYDFSSNTDYQYDITNGDYIYVRKDSLFTQGLKDNDYDNFSNPEKLFLYLGRGYQNNEYIRINHYALKNGMLNAIPTNNRNNRLDEFIYKLYDQMHHKTYESQKNIFSLFDPYEISDSRISNISEIHNEEPLSTEIDTFKRRVYVDNLIYGLKKKGTYSSLFIIWHILTKETGNELTVYDRWHTLLPSGSEPLNHFVDYDHVEFYTTSSGTNYPTEYNTSGKVLSPHYKVEMTIDSNPFSDYVLSQEMMTDLYDKGENTRPATKYAGYHIDVSINSDLSGDYVSLYKNPIYDANILSASILFTEAVSGAAIYVQTSPATTGTFNHDLNSINIITHVYDLNLNRMEPKSITIINSSRVNIEFSYKTLGSVFIVDADYTRTQGVILNNGTINHLLNSKYVLSQFYDEGVVMVDKTTATDSNNLNVETVGLNGYGFIEASEYVHTQNALSESWTVTHNLGYIGVMLDVYNGNDEKIKPDIITLDNINQCTLTFSEAVSGNCSVIPIGNPSLGGDIASKFSGTGNIKLGNSSNIDEGDYVTENDLKSSFYTQQCSASYFTKEADGVRFQFSIPRNVEGYITELGIFNNEGDISWISKIDYLYKHKDVILDVNYYAQYEDL